MNNTKTTETSQDFSQTLTETLIRANYKKGKDEKNKPRRPKHRYFAVMPETILTDKELSDNAKLIYTVISRYTGDRDGKEASIGREKIGEKLGKSTFAVDKGIKELKDKGLAVRTRRGKKDKRGNTSAYTTLKERLHENELEDFFFQPYSPEFYEKLEKAPSVFSYEDGTVRAKLDMTLEDWDRDLLVEYYKLIPHLLVEYYKLIPSDKDPRAQGKQDDLGVPSREVQAVLREVYNSGSTSDDLFATVTTSQLNDKKPSNYNVNELIATLQLEALDAGVVFEARDGDAGKLRGQVSDLQDKLKGAGEVVKFYQWYFKDPRRVKRFEHAPNSFKLHKVLDELANYRTHLERRRKSKRDELEIDLGAPSSPYSREDLASLNLEELEDIKRDKVGTS